MLLLETWVPQMVASRLSVLHHLHSIMIHIFIGSLWQRMRPNYRIAMDIGYDPLGFLPGVGFGKQFLTN